MKNTLIQYLHKKANPQMAKHSQRFFKTGTGEYGEGDLFLGIRVPELRKAAKKFLSLTDAEIAEILQNPYHEIRLTGLFVLVYQFEKADEKRRKEIFNFYLKHLDAVNNWDLVDTTTPQILGKYLVLHPDKNRDFLYDFAASKNLWHRRIAILTTHAFIRVGALDDTLKISEKLLGDTHDLIHKAVGWMLREMGKKDEKTLLQFLDQHVSVMPRTMLRYTIERLEEDVRQKYLKKSS
jgi:3-methyladenine DNA glycosylase AlkD